MKSFTNDSQQDAQQPPQGAETKGQQQPRTETNLTFNGPDADDFTITTTTFTDEQLVQQQQQAIQTARETACSAVGSTCGQQAVSLGSREAKGVNEALRHPADVVDGRAVTARRGFVSCFQPGNPGITAQIGGLSAGNMADRCVLVGTHLIRYDARIFGSLAFAGAVAFTGAEIYLTTNGQLRPVSNIVAVTLPGIAQERAVQVMGSLLAGEIKNAPYVALQVGDARAFIQGVTRGIATATVGLSNDGAVVTVVADGAAAYASRLGIDEAGAALCNLGRQAVANIPGDLGGAVTSAAVNQLMVAVDNHAEQNMPVPPSASELKLAQVARGVVAVGVSGLTTAAINAALPAGATLGVAATTAGAVIISPAVVVPTFGLFVAYHAFRQLGRNTRVARAGLGAPGAAGGLGGPGGGGPGGPGGDGQDGDRPGSEQQKNQKGR